MPRPKKGDAPAKVAAAPIPMMPAPIAASAPAPFAMPVAAPAETRIIDYQQFIRVRDAVIGRFGTLQKLIGDFSADYIRQTNMLIGEPTAVENLPSLQGLATLDQAGALGFGAPVAAFAPPVEEKKERKKRSHDPNAPKRPLTPYFLYMQTARPIIATDLGADAPKGAVQEEGQRRWASMGPNDKQAWNNAYQFNLRLYNARVHSYKAGNQDARNMDDTAALQYADTNSIPMPAANDASAAPNESDAIAEQLSSTVPAPTADDATKTPKNKGGRKRKSTAADAEEVGDASTAKIATPATASPEKKRKRASKAADVTEEPKKSGRKKKST